MKKILHIMLIIIGLCILLVILMVFFADLRINTVSDKYISDDLSKLPENQVVLVLGTAKWTAPGQINPFFQYRMEAAKELYDAGKVKAFVLSGDNRKMNYNEPMAMRKSLLQMGIPDSIIYLDYAGFRTLDSVIRIHKIFGQTNFIVVSQKFHNQRAVFIARKNGLEAYGYNAKDVPVNFAVKTFIRERFARVKVFIDILTKKEPKFLGEPIEIP